jgi:uncharacterized membrane protein
LPDVVLSIAPRFTHSINRQVKFQEVTRLQLYDLLKLIGVVIIVVGIALRLRTTLVVVVAALVTGLVAGLPLFSHEGFFQSLPLLTKPGQPGIINTLGRAFADNRLMTLFILTLPAIGLAERYGLQEEAAALIRKIRAATVGRLQLVYLLFRVLHGAMGIRLNGHPSFVRPLIFPMSLGAMQARYSTESVSDQRLALPVPPPSATERIKAANAAAENYGNFYGQNLNPVQAGVLLVFGVMQGLGYTIALWDLVKFTVPIVIASVLLAALQFWWLDRRLRAEVTR